jgi:hypothetical protein
VAVVIAASGCSLGRRLCRLWLIQGEDLKLVGYDGRRCARECPARRRSRTEHGRARSGAAAARPTGCALWRYR